MNKRTLVQTVTTTCALLAFAGTGCSDGDKGNAQVAALCAKLDAKQAELTCKENVLKRECGAGDTACQTQKESDLAACSAIGGSGGAVGSSSSTSTSTSTATNTFAQGFVDAARGACGGNGQAISSSSSTSTSTGVQTTSTIPGPATN